ncbi:MAG: hypothetical protein ACYS18_09385 [Planctomycetota bacterium]|jgi:hypothetical protein
MNTKTTFPKTPVTGRNFLIAIMTFAIVLTIAQMVHARNPIRDAFFDVYPNAVGTTIEDVNSQANHCGVCHFEFTGGGPRNPYGQLLEAELPNWGNKQKDQAVIAIQNQDPDVDGYSTLTEVTDVTTFGNTPTFPGLTPSNVGSVTSVDVTEQQLPSSYPTVERPTPQIPAPPLNGLPAMSAASPQLTSTSPSTTEQHINRLNLA